MINHHFITLINLVLIYICGHDEKEFWQVWNNEPGTVSWQFGGFTPSMLQCQGDLGISTYSDFFLNKTAVIRVVNLGGFDSDPTLKKKPASNLIKSKSLIIIH